MATRRFRGSGAGSVPGAATEYCVGTSLPWECDCWSVGAAGSAWRMRLTPAQTHGSAMAFLYHRHVDFLSANAGPRESAWLEPAAPASAAAAAARAAAARARRAWARRHAARGDARQVADTAGEARDVEGSDAAAVPLRRLAIDVLERVGPFLLDTKRHCVGQILLEQLG